MKKRKQKAIEYLRKYSDMPKDYNERLEWLCDNLHLTPRKMDDIVSKYYDLKNKLSFKTIFIVLYEEPEGSPRPRFRLVNRKNLANIALKNPSFVHVYSPTGADDNKFMKRLMNEEDFTELDSIIYTPCICTYTVFFRTPTYFNAIDTYLAELGVHTPITKPDWDNIGKKYSDMSNSNLWLDDRLVIEGTVKKFYSVLPRVEIRIDYLNMLTTKYQAKSIQASYDGAVRYYGKEEDRKND